MTVVAVTFEPKECSMRELISLIDESYMLIHKYMKSSLASCVTDLSTENNRD